MTFRTSEFSLRTIHEGCLNNDWTRISESVRIESVDYRRGGHFIQTTYAFVALHAVVATLAPPGA